MYFWIVRLHTRIPSLSNSPRIRSAPQSRFFLAISLINTIVSGESFGCLESALDFRFQNKRKSPRCHRSTVSGCTMKSACFQVRVILARNNKRNRSDFLHAGPFGQVCDRSKQKGGRARFHPTNNAIRARVKAPSYSLPEKDENREHRLLLCEEREKGTYI
jgi:hypothetical protein